MLARKISGIATVGLLDEAILGLTAGFKLWEELVLKVGVNSFANAILKKTCWIAIKTCKALWTSA